MSGIRLYRRFKEVEEEAAKVGFCFADDPYGRNGDMICLRPMDDPNVLPPYSRTATFFRGDIDQIAAFLAGIRWAREYDMTLGYQIHKTRKASEEKYVERLRKEKEKRDAKNIMKILKGEEPDKDDTPF